MCLFHSIQCSTWSLPGYCVATLSARHRILIIFLLFFVSTNASAVTYSSFAFTQGTSAYTDTLKAANSISEASTLSCTRMGEYVTALYNPGVVTDMVAVKEGDDTCKLTYKYNNSGRINYHSITSTSCINGFTPYASGVSLLCQSPPDCSKAPQFVMPLSGYIGNTLGNPINQVCFAYGANECKYDVNNVENVFRYTDDASPTGINVDLVPNSVECEDMAYTLVDPTLEPKKPAATQTYCEANPTDPLCSGEDPNDVDGDGIPNNQDVDFDSDGDGTPNGQDPDSPVCQTNCNPTQPQDPPPPVIPPEKPIPDTSAPPQPDTPPSPLPAPTPDPGDPTPDPVDGPGPGTASVSGACSVTPTCSGDAIQCAILYETWRGRCNPIDAVEYEQVNDALIDYAEGMKEDIFKAPIDVTSALNVQSEYGTCPAPLQLNLLGNTVDISWQVFCDIAVLIRPLIIAGAYLGVMFMFVRSS